MVLFRESFHNISSHFQLKIRIAMSSSVFLYDFLLQDYLEFDRLADGVYLSASLCIDPISLYISGTSSRQKGDRERLRQCVCLRVLDLCEFNALNLFIPSSVGLGLF